MTVSLEQLRDELTNLAPQFSLRVGFGDQTRKVGVRHVPDSHFLIPRHRCVIGMAHGCLLAYSQPYAVSDSERPFTTWPIISSNSSNVTGPRFSSLRRRTDTV